MSDKHVLLLRLSGPLQAWGVESRFSVRDTTREPSKSGVVGLLCAALGRTRDRPIEDLAALRMGVRVEQEGPVLRDFHVAGVGGYYKASGAVERDNVIPGNRYYLMSARFLVGLEGDDLALLSNLHAALRDPVWPLYLGRKACVPGEPVWLCDGLRQDETLEQALCTYRWLGPPWDKPSETLRVVLEDPDGPIRRPDQPLSFAERRFAPRRVSVHYWPAPPVRAPEEAPCTSQD
ncbi:MAG: type I-E CRISPR-associated protein Cas5/CasD [Anaerolineae bacterium]